MGSQAEPDESSSAGDVRQHPSDPGGRSVDCLPIGRSTSQVDVFGKQVRAGFNILLADDIPEVGQVNLIEEREARFCPCSVPEP